MMGGLQVLAGEVVFADRPFSDPLISASARSWFRAIPCPAMFEQRHKIIHNRVALGGEESVSGVTGGSGRRANQENPPMRTYIIGSDGIALCRETPAAVNDGEMVVSSKEELLAAPLNGKRLLALWNALPGVEKRRRVGDRKAARSGAARRPAAPLEAGRGDCHAASA